MHDAHARGHYPEIVELPLRPGEKRVALSVPLDLEGYVAVAGIVGAVVVHLHRMIDHKVDRHLRVDEPRVPSLPEHLGAHSRQIDGTGNPGEILQKDPRRHEWDLDPLVRGRLPGRHRPHVVLGRHPVAGVTHHVL